MAIQGEGVVEFAHQFLGSLAVHTHHNAVGFHKILNGSTLLQEFGIGGHIKRNIHTSFLLGLLERIPHLFCGSHRYGTLGDHQSIIAHVLTDLSGHGQNVFQIGRTIFTWRSTDSNERYFASSDGRRQIGGEAQSLFFEVALDDHVQARLVNGQDAFFQIFDLFYIHIHAADVQTYICQTGTSDQANIACSYNDDFHDFSFCFVSLSTVSSVVELIKFNCSWSISV